MTLSLVPKELSSVTMICELAVTAVVFTLIMIVSGAMVTLPDGAEPQTAGEVLEKQFVIVVRTPNFPR